MNKTETSVSSLVSWFAALEKKQRNSNDSV